MAKGQPSNVESQHGVFVLGKLFADETSPQKVFGQVKHFAPDPDFNAVIKLATPENHPLHSQVFGNPFPQNYEGLHSGEVFWTGPIEIEARWTAASLERYSQAIHTFLALSNIVERNTVLGNYSVAAEALDRLQQRFGVSLFLIRNRVLLAELQGGLEANARQLAELRERKCNSYVLGLAGYGSLWRVLCL